MCDVDKHMIGATADRTDIATFWTLHIALICEGGRSSSKASHHHTMNSSLSLWRWQALDQYQTCWQFLTLTHNVLRKCSHVLKTLILVAEQHFFLSWILDDFRHNFWSARIEHRFFVIFNSQFVFCNSVRFLERIEQITAERIEQHWMYLYRGNSISIVISKSRVVKQLWYLFSSPHLGADIP